MNLEEELNRSWNTYSSGQPIYMRGGRLEVDEPQLEMPTVDPMGMATGAGAPAAPVSDRPAKIDWNDPEQARKYGTNSIGPVDTTMREDGRDAMTNFLTSLGTDPYRARDLSERIWGSTNPLSQHGIGALDAMFLPGAVMGIEEGVNKIDEGIVGMQAGRDGAGLDLAVGIGLTVLNGLPLGAAGKDAAERIIREYMKLPHRIPGPSIERVTGAIPGPQMTAQAMRRPTGEGSDATVIRGLFTGRGSTEMRQAALDEVARVRALYPEADGWAPLELVGGEMVKGKFEPKWKQPAYNFHTPPEGVSKEQWQTQLADRMTQDVQGVVERAAQGDEAAKFILSQAAWYRDMRNRLRSEFGGMADLFADLLGTTSAQTGVRMNWDNAVEIMRRFSRGEYDREIANYERAIQAGEDPNKVFSRIRKEKEAQGMTPEQAAAAAQEEYPLLAKASGALFGANSPTSTGALIDTFRQIKAGASPKTPNFTGNLIGYTNEATVDVWAARYLSDIAGQPRIPPAAEKAVSGKHLVGSSIEEPRVGGEFGFGQKVFKEAADKINAQGVIPGEKLGADDLQAVVWFIEKEKWTNKGWTNKTGEGGSLDFEANRAGTANPERLNELRKIINASGTTDAEKLAAQAEYDDLAAPVDRTVLGISGERPDRPMSNYGQAELAAEIDDVLRADDAVIMYKAANTYGRFMKTDERALDVEVVTRKGFDPSALERRTIELGKQYDQDAVFVSKVLRRSDESPNARPGVEIYFGKKQSADAVRALTDTLNARGIDGFTFVTDMRQPDRVNVQAMAGGADTADIVGVRFQYIPEFDDAFSEARRAEIIREKRDAFIDVVADLMERPDVSSAQLVWYDTKVTFRDQYDARLAASGGRPLRGGEARQGQQGGSGSAGAAGSAGPGPIGQGAIPDGQRP